MAIVDGLTDLVLLFDIIINVIDLVLRLLMLIIIGPIIHILFKMGNRFAGGAHNQTFTLTSLFKHSIHEVIVWNACA